MRGSIDDVPAAIGDCTYVFATTARPRGMTMPIVTPERAMQQARAMLAAGGKVAVLFGPERAGLENADIARANAIISVPVNPDFPSLNLAQCVLLCAYEFRRAGDATPPEVMEMAGTDFATGGRDRGAWRSYRGTAGGGRVLLSRGQGRPRCARTCARSGGGCR